MVTLCAICTRLSILVPAANDRRPKRAPVNRHVGPDFHVVVDDDQADLRHFAMDARVKHVAESIRADHRPGMNADALANLGQRIKNDPGKQIRLRADDAMFAKVVAALQNGARPDLNFFANVTKRADMRRRVNLRRRRDDRGRVDAGRKCLFREEQGQHAGKGNPGVGNANQDFAGRGEGAVHQDGGGGALFGFGEKSLVFREGQIAGFGGDGGRETGQDDGAIAQDFSLEFLGKLGGGEH